MPWPRLRPCSRARSPNRSPTIYTAESSLSLHPSTPNLHRFFISGVVSLYGCVRYSGYMTAMPATGSQFFDSPATYQIQVQGRLAAGWSELLEGMTIQESGLKSGVPVTTLRGKLPDQAALAGVLNQLYLLHMTVLSVARLEDVDI